VSKADNLTTILCRCHVICETLTSWNPLGHSRPVTGLLYPFLVPLCPQILTLSFPLMFLLSFFLSFLFISFLFSITCVLSFRVFSYYFVFRISLISLLFLTFLPSFPVPIYLFIYFVFSNFLSFSSLSVSC
jgi:hypothetical protein